MKAMKKFLYKPVVLLAAIIAGAATLSSQEVTRNFSKTFPVKPSTTVTIDNRYGEVTVETWNRNEVSIDVNVKVELPTMERSERLISLIGIEFVETDTSVGAVTVLDDRFSATLRGFGNNKFTIDYTVRMPASNSLNAVHSYGNLKISDLAGKVNIDLRYGTLIILNLARGNEKPINSISVAYSKVTIENANWISMISRYSTDMKINQVQAMTLDSRYSKIFVDKAGSIVADSKYDNLRIGEINNLVAESAYTNYKLETLTGQLSLDTRYGSIETVRIPAGFRDITVNSAYANEILGIDKSAAYKLDAKVNYGSLSFCEECVILKRQFADRTSHEISGVAGKSDYPASTVDITASYGSVTLR
jgi:hypothetical protein